MKAKDLIAILDASAEFRGVTVDTVKAGETGRELKKVAVTMTATVGVIRELEEWGADLVIVHEPTFYTNGDECAEDIVSQTKKRLVENSGIVFYRYHDRIHAFRPDMINEGMLHYMGLSGGYKTLHENDHHIITLERPRSALELAQTIEQKLGVKHVRICGERNKKSTVVATYFGAPAGDAMYKALKNEEVEIVMAGEACEWVLAEYAKDASAMGINKTLMIIGHAGSERDGMRFFAEKLAAEYDDFEVKYFDSGEVYTYTDS